MSMIPVAEGIELYCEEIGSGDRWLLTCQEGFQEGDGYTGIVTSLLSGSIDPFVEILSVDPSCDRDKTFGLELVVQPPYDLVGIGGRDAELGGDFLYTHKFVFHKDLLSFFCC